MKLKHAGIGLGTIIGTLWMAALLAGCTITVDPALINALTNQPPSVLTNITQVTTNIVTEPSKPTTPSGDMTTATGPIVDPLGYTEESVAANSHYEECHIEPATGLLVRYTVWRPSVKGWWMLSSLGEGHVRLEGDKANGTLVADNFTKNGQAVEVVGFTDYEIHKGETPETVRYLAKGNRCPYNHTRRYVVVQCREASQ